MKIILLNILLLFSAKMGQGFAKSFELQKVFFLNVATSHSSSFIY